MANYRRSIPLDITPKFDKDPSTKKKRTVIKYTTPEGAKVKSVETRSGKRKETYKDKKTGYKSKQVSKDGVIKKTVTKTPTSKHKETEKGKRRKVTTKTRI